MMTPQEEWNEAVRVARIMERQSIEFAPPPGTKRGKHFERMSEQAAIYERSKKRKKAAPIDVNAKPLKRKIFPFISRSWRQRYIDADTREFVYTRDEGRCFYCHCDVPRFGAHLDHVLPVARGGLSTYENLVLSCAKCNISKHASILENLNEILAEVRRRNREVFG